MCDTLELVCCCKQCLPPGYRVIPAKYTSAFAFVRGDEYPHGRYDTEADAIRGAIEHHCRAVGLCKPQLHDVVLFRVYRRVIRCGVMRTEEHGYTDDLSVALSYKDRNSAAFIDVWRGFKDETGRLYSSKRNPLVSICRVR